MATDAGPLRRRLNGPVHGVALALYFALLPYVVVTKWAGARHETQGTLVRVLLVALAVIWLVFLVQLIRNVRRLRRGRRLGPGGNAWLGDADRRDPALPARRPPRDERRARAGQRAIRRRGARSFVAGSRHRRASALPLALMARRRRDELRRGAAVPDDARVDDTIELLRGFDPALVDSLERLIGDRAPTASCAWARHPPADGCRRARTRSSSCVVRDSRARSSSPSRARGASCACRCSGAAEDVIDAAVALHDGGRLVFTADRVRAVRALATRSLRRTLVVHLGAAGALDDELRACAVTLSPVLFDERGRSGASCAARGTAAEDVATADDVRVELLRAEPRVTGLVEPFTPTLRRRCVEMVAYLALHRHEPVTGERLRARVLATRRRRRVHAHARQHRQLGPAQPGRRRARPPPAPGDVVGPLRDPRRDRATSRSSTPWSREPARWASWRRRRCSSGRSAWCTASPWRARCGGSSGSSPRATRRASSATPSGPLSPCSRVALQSEDFETAFWALGQGRLVDPYSDALDDALRRVPRLREFGGDGPGRAQHLAVGAGGAEETGGSLARLVDETVQ